MFSAFFIKNPVFAAVCSIIIVLAGVASLVNLPIEQYPRVLPPQITVSASYPGASAETIAKTVIAPLEERINGSKDMIYMNSVAEDSGRAKINILFTTGKNAEEAKVDITNRVQTALPRLPEEVRRIGVIVEESSPSTLKFIGFSSPNGTYDRTYIYNYVLQNIADDLKRIQGVSNVTVYGNKDYSIRVWIDPLRLKEHNLAVTDVIAAIREQNMQYAAGQIGQEPISQKQMFTYTIKTPTRLETAEEFQNIIIRSNSDGSALVLKDVANVELDAESYNVVAKLNNSPSIGVGISLQSDANALNTGKNIDKFLKEASKYFPEDITYSIPYDTTKFIQLSINQVIMALFEAIILVVLVIYLFLQNWRATLIPSLAVPVSVIGTFALIYAFGFTINLLTLFGLVLAIGIVVDDAIVVIENVERHMSEGMSPKEASLKAMEEVSSALIAIVLVIASVFIPVAFLGGLTGEMYKQFAMTIVISVTISGFVALTLTPSLCATILKAHSGRPRGFFRWFNRQFDRATNGYVSIVKRAIRYAFLSVLIFLGVTYASYDILKSMKTGLVPTEDQGNFILFNFNPPGSSLSRTEELQEQVYEIVFQNENVRSMLNIVGLDFTTSSLRTSSISSFVDLKDWSDRENPEQSVVSVVADINKKLQATTEGVSLAVIPPPIQGLGLTGGFTMYVQDRTGGDIRDLENIVNEIVRKANQRPELMAVRSSLNANIPQYQIELDTIKAKAKGVNIADIYTTLNSTLGSFYINDFSILGRTYRVNMQAKDNFRSKPSDLEKIYVKTSTGEMIPISSFVTLKEVVGADIVERFNLFQAAKVEGQPETGFSSGDALRAIEEVALESLPQGYSISWAGTSYQEKQVSSSSGQAFVFGMILLYLILAAQYGKWLIPITIILAVPFAILGAVVATSLRGLDNDIYFQIGLLVLAGLAAKNAILIVEFAMQMRKTGMSLADSALEAAKLRLRPIIMTSLAFTIGVVPLALSSGAGAASRQSIGTGVVGGMIAATFIAIIFIPVFYVLISKLSGEKETPKKEEIEA